MSSRCEDSWHVIERAHGAKRFLSPDGDWTHNKAEAQPFTRDESRTMAGALAIQHESAASWCSYGVEAA